MANKNQVVIVQSVLVLVERKVFRKTNNLVAFEEHLNSVVASLFDLWEAAENGASWTIHQSEIVLSLAVALSWRELQWQQWQFQQLLSSFFKVSVTTSFSAFRSKLWTYVICTIGLFLQPTKNALLRRPVFPGTLHSTFPTAEDQSLWCDSETSYNHNGETPWMERN